MEIVNFEKKHISKVKDFLDLYAGNNYLTEDDLIHIVDYKSFLKNKNCSFVAIEEDEIVGVRITFAPSKWINIDKGLSKHLWNAPESTVAKFHCLFVSDSHQGRGIGPKLSKASISVLKEMDAKAIISHSWLESPNNSSQKYLLKYGFLPLKIYKLFWHETNYFCSGCRRNKCICSAEEMIYYIS